MINYRAFLYDRFV